MIRKTDLMTKTRDLQLVDHRNHSITWKSFTDWIERNHKKVSLS